MKYCTEYAALLDPFVDGELSPEEAARVRAHLETCGGCRSYVDAALAIRGAFPDGADTDVPSGFAEGVMAAIRASSGAPAPQKRPVPWKRVLAPIAACLIIVAAAGRLSGVGNVSFGRSTGSTSASVSASPSTAEAAVPQAETDAELGEPQSGSAEAASSAWADQIEAAADTLPAPRQSLKEDGAAVEDAGAYARLAQTALTAEQTARLLGAYDGQPQADGSVLYVLTAQELDDVLAALDREDLPASLQDGNAEAARCCLTVWANEN